MNRPSFSLRLSSLRRVAACAALACLAIPFLLRLGTWGLGSDQIHVDIKGVPQITEWRMDDPDFGGMSALIIDSTGTALVAGGDHGALVEARVTRGSADEITGIQGAALSKVLLRDGRTPSDFKMDLEALTRDPQGGWLVGYEGFVRIERLAHAQARPVATHRWEKFIELFGNQAFEALATLPDGRVIAITETGPIAASMILDGKVWKIGPDIPISAGYLITGADVGPDGCLYLLERRYSVAGGFQFGVRRLSGRPGAWADTLLYRSAPAQLGNAEGISIWENAAGLIVLSLITDNGFWPLTTTRLIELHAQPGVGCVTGF